MKLEKNTFFMKKMSNVLHLLYKRASLLLIN